jgi:hypothetical protein
MGQVPGGELHPGEMLVRLARPWHATINGVATTYRIDVDDNAEPGAGSDTFKFQSGNGYTVGGTLTKGNIQVHT